MLDQMMKMLEGQQIGPYRLNKFLGAWGNLLFSIRRCFI